MSRPIDADRLKELYEPYKGLDVPCAVVCQNIDDMPTVQPQGIDKDRLIRDLNLNTNYGFYGEFTDGSEVAFTLRELMEIIKQQPTSDGWIPCGKGSRLTRRAGTDDVYCIDSHKCVDGDCYDCPHFAYMRNKLACYEELEEQGRLAYLPQPYKESENND